MGLKKIHETIPGGGGCGEKRRRLSPRLEQKKRAEKHGGVGEKPRKDPNIGTTLPYRREKSPLST